jgi:hypothetical protein
VRVVIAALNMATPTSVPGVIDGDSRLELATLQAATASKTCFDTSLGMKHMHRIEPVPAIAPPLIIYQSNL